MPDQDEFHRCKNSLKEAIRQNLEKPAPENQESISQTHPSPLNLTINGGIKGDLHIHNSFFSCPFPSCRRF